MIRDFQKHVDARKSVTPYLIVSPKHTYQRDEYVTFWRPGRNGYAMSIPWAGRYSEAEARRITDDNTSKDAFAVLYTYAERLAVPADRMFTEGPGPCVPRNLMRSLRAVRGKW